MLGFPTPYPNELLYSVIARAGVHEGETSAKQLLDLVFANRKVIATVDLPSHVECIADQYPLSLNLSAEEIIKKHTLWPVYAPFLPRERRTAIEKWMIGRSQGAAHLASGIAASRVMSNQVMQLCESCKLERKSKFGETFWDRRWQVPLVDCCSYHGPLSMTDINFNGEHRHAFIPVEQSKITKRGTETKSGMRFSKLVFRLFDSFIKESPSYHQWTQYYRSLAIENGFLLGNRIDHRKILQQYIDYWGIDWLKSANLLPNSRDTSWLKGIFRKHRKVFSFAEHLTVLDAISQGKAHIAQVIEKALRFQKMPEKSKTVAQVERQELTEDQNSWLALLVDKGPKAARLKQPDLYARLYRNHYDWLMDVDDKYHIPPVAVNRRVEWASRDRESANDLLNFIRQAEKDLSLPRLSRAFLLHQLDNRATVEKNLYRMPRCAALLKRYAESVDEYQVRRLTRSFIGFIESKKTVKRWVLLRKAGLSEERMSSIVKRFLEEIVRDGERSKIQTY